MLLNPIKLTILTIIMSKDIAREMLLKEWQKIPKVRRKRQERSDQHQSIYEQIGGVGRPM
jgi:hypothetical protein